MCKHCEAGSEGDTHILCALCDKTYLWMVMSTVIEAGERKMLCPSCFYLIKGAWPR